jgi:hydroxymethylpyrimidine pyrophosphatase-like HAD family hydrolase
MNDLIKQLITNPCLIAADIDNTILKHGDSNERHEFFLNQAPELIKAAGNGTNLAVITGNSLEELSSRFLRYLLDYLIIISDIKLLSRFHFFSNSGGIHLHFNSEEIKNICNGAVDECIFYKNSTIVQSKFINKEYLNHTKINDSDIEIIGNILTDEWKKYIEDFKGNIDEFKNEFYIDNVPIPNCDSKEYKLKDIESNANPVDMRFVEYGNEFKFTVQITLKPILSWKHAINQKDKINNDPRTKLISKIHKRFNEKGLFSYTASAGGNSSIDVTRSKLDKSYALRYLIDFLGIEGAVGKGQKLGSNVLYLGDEVISGGGNDYPVTNIDGLLVLALNKVPDFVPFKSRVIIPSDLSGPDGAGLVLSQYNSLVLRELQKWENKIKKGEFPKKNAIQLFKEDWFTKEIEKKILNKDGIHNNLSTEQLRVLYTFITLIYRNDSQAIKWTNLLVNELDDIMEAIDTNETERLKGIGSSRPKE